MRISYKKPNQIINQKKKNRWNKPNQEAKKGMTKYLFFPQNEFKSSSFCIV